MTHPPPHRHSCIHRTPNGQHRIINTHTHTQNIYICVHTHAQIHRHTHTHACTQTHAHTQIETQRHTYTMRTQVARADDTWIDHTQSLVRGTHCKVRTRCGVLHPATDTVVLSPSHTHTHIMHTPTKKKKPLFHNSCVCVQKRFLCVLES